MSMKHSKDFWQLIIVASMVILLFAVIQIPQSINLRRTHSWKAPVIGIPIAYLQPFAPQNKHHHNTKNYKDTRDILAQKEKQFLGHVISSEEYQAAYHCCSSAHGKLSARQKQQYLMPVNVQRRSGALKQFGECMLPSDGVLTLSIDAKITYWPNQIITVHHNRKINTFWQKQCTPRKLDPFQFMTHYQSKQFVYDGNKTTLSQVTKERPDIMQQHWDFATFWKQNIIKWSLYLRHQCGNVTVELNYLKKRHYRPHYRDKVYRIHLVYTLLISPSNASDPKYHHERAYDSAESYHSEGSVTQAETAASYHSSSAGE